MKLAQLIILLFTITMCQTPDVMEHTQWAQDKLKLPFVIRQPNKTDIPAGDSTFLSWKERQSVVLEEGYIFSLNDNKDDSTFKFYSEINVDNPSLWKLSKALLGNLDGVAYAVYNLHEEEVRYGNKIPLADIIQKLDKIESDILNNCSVSIGVVQYENELHEVFIDESKYIKYWGTDETFFKEVMAKFGIEEKQEMDFVDQYPKLVYDWNFVNSSAKTNEELMRYLEVQL